jgi:hypothetical protein
MKTAKASTSFSGEKEAKRLFLLWVMGVVTDSAHHSELNSGCLFILRPFR